LNLFEKKMWRLSN